MQIPNRASPSNRITSSHSVAISSHTPGAARKCVTTSAASCCISAVLKTCPAAAPAAARGRCMAGSGRPAARETGMLKTCPAAAPAAARGRCMAGSGRPAAREAGMLKTCPVAAPAAARGRCMAGSGLPTARELAGISYRSTACNRRTCSQSKNPGCCRIADTEPNNLRELRKSPSSSLIYPTSCHSNSAAGYPSGLAVLRQLPPASCFTEPPGRASARVTLIACTAFRRRSHRPADQNTAVIVS